jgi:hypothetical protein
MIDLSIIVYLLSLGVEIGVGPSGDCEDCHGWGKCRVVTEVLGFVVGWWRRIGFGLDLRVSVVWYWVCDLWHCQRICYL